MRRTIVLFVTAIISLTFWNVKAEECSGEQIESSLNALENLTYNLEYYSDYHDMNGDRQEGFYKITLPNLPADYKAVLTTPVGEYGISGQNYTVITGGVTRVDIYLSACSGVVKTFTIKVPSYKQFCKLDKECDNVWFDGTTNEDNKETKGDSKEEIKIDYRLILALIVTIIIIAFVVRLIIRKRRFNAEDF